MHSNILPHQPIAVFDSGIGGLTVLTELQKQMPGESFIYLGDHARLPYGTKSKEIIQNYALQCTRFLMRFNPKLLVVACNTVSATALAQIEAAFNIPVFGVVQSGVAACLTSKKTPKNVLVLATQSTITSGAYQNEIRMQSPSTNVSAIACPLLVPLAEEGWWDNDVTELVIKKYLGNTAVTFDSVILGCTHYPLLMPSLKKVFAPNVKIVHGAMFLSREIESYLFKKELISDKAASLKLFATDRIAPEHPLLKLFDHPVDFETVDL